MKDEPADLSCDDIARLLDTHWGFRAAEVAYAAVGGGSYHWMVSDGRGPRWFVTANHLDPRGSWLGPTADGTRIAVEAAALATKELSDRGYEFVVAPLPDRSGTLVRHVLPSWTLLVLPYLEGWSTSHGVWNDPGERAQVARLLGRLHAATPPEALRRWGFALPGRDALRAALGELGRPWADCGPYSEPTRRRLAGALDHLDAQLGRYDALVRQVDRSDPWVVTHGEPHSANVIRTDDGELLLIDWDTAQLAPRERDLAALHEGPSAADYLAAYQAEAGSVGPRPEMIELFHLWWALAEIAGYVQPFRDPHADSADSEQSWHNLTMYVPG